MAGPDGSAVTGVVVCGGASGAAQRGSAERRAAAGGDGDGVLYRRRVDGADSATAAGWERGGIEGAAQHVLPVHPLPTRTAAHRHATARLGAASRPGPGRERPGRAVHGPQARPSEPPPRCARRAGPA